MSDTNYEPKKCLEWIEDTQSSISAVAFRGNEAVIDWLYAGKKHLGKAISEDGVNYKWTCAGIAYPS